jgi:hypothetical protein
MQAKGRRGANHNTRTLGDSEMERENVIEAAKFRNANSTNRITNHVLQVKYM